MFILSAFGELKVWNGAQLILLEMFILNARCMPIFLALLCLDNVFSEYLDFFARNVSIMFFYNMSL